MTTARRFGSASSVEGDGAVEACLELVAGVVGQRVVSGAEESAVLGAGVAALAPGLVVVGVTHRGWPIAAVGGAAAVA